MGQRGVRGLVGRILEANHLPEFKSSTLEATKYQGDLFPKMRSGDHNTMGFFYEIVTRGLYDGVLANTKKNLRESFMKPDVVSEVGIGESKACCVGHSCNLLDGQIRRYSAAIGEGYPPVYFSFYRHDLKGIKSSFSGTEEDLFAVLAEKTLFSLRLPFSVVLAMHESVTVESPANDYVYRYESKGDKKEQGKRQAYPSCTCLRSSAINAFLESPLEVLSGFGLPIQDYDVDTYISPRGFKVAGIEMNQFPILYIKHKDLYGWVEDYKSRNEVLDAESLVMQQDVEEIGEYSEPINGTASSVEDPFIDPERVVEDDNIPF